MDRLDVLGENEALQQFFEGQDVHRALDNPMVDTSMLEQYISSDFAFGPLLPDSPPDSGSEPCSPPQISGLIHSSCWSNGFHPTSSTPSGSCRYIERSIDTSPGSHSLGASPDTCMKMNNLETHWNGSALPNCTDYNYPFTQQPLPQTISGMVSPNKKRKHSHLDEKDKWSPWSMDTQQCITYLNL